MKKLLMCLIACSVLTVSCARWNTAYRRKSIGNGGTAIAVDAKQRFLVATQDARKRDGSNKPATAGAADDRDALLRICAEPSPDVFSVLAASMEGSAKYKDKASADFKAALSEAAATIGTRTETIQLLRDAMYRVCELALSGELTTVQAFELHKSYQQSMVTLAAVSALADTTRPTQVGISGRATVTRGALLADLTKQVEEAQKDKAAKDKAKADADAPFQEAAKAMWTTKVDCDDGAKSAAACAIADGGIALSDALINGAAATTSDEKTSRASDCCSSERNTSAQPCVALTKAAQDAKSATTNAANAKATVEQLQAEIEDVKKNADLGAVTEVVRLAPTTAQPSPANIHEVACVVRRLVSQVYATDHVAKCLEWMEKAEEAAERRSEAEAEKLKVKEDLKGKSSKGAESMFRSYSAIAPHEIPGLIVEKQSGVIDLDATSLRAEEVLSGQAKAASEDEARYRAFVTICEKVSGSLSGGDDCGSMATPPTPSAETASAGAQSAGASGKSTPTPAGTKHSVRP